MLLQLWEQWLGPAACCSSSTNSPGPSPCAGVTSSLSLDEPGHKNSCFPTPALHLWGCCPRARDGHPDLTPPAPQRRAFHAHVLCVPVACDAGTALPPARLPPPRFPTGSAPSPGTATLEQNWSRAVHRQLSHIPNRSGRLSRSPAAILAAAAQTARAVRSALARALGSTDTPQPQGNHTAPGKPIWGAEAGREDTLKLYPHHTVWGKEWEKPGYRIWCRSIVGKLRDMGFGVGE